MKRLVLWRPAVNVPYGDSMPTYALREKKTSFGKRPICPFCGWKKLSSVKIAFMPAPRSSAPFMPK